MFTPENITELKENEIFVFGSNLMGNHIGGAAKYAKDHFGAEEPIGEGLTGQCYAFPTLDYSLGKRDGVNLNISKEKLFATARALPEKIFLLTRVGTGIAGYSEKEMAILFKGGPANIIKPENW